MNTVTIRKCPDYDYDRVYAIVKQAITTSSIFPKLNENTTVLLKPNMLTRATPNKAVTTNPVIVDCVARVLIESGVKERNITLADSSAGPNSTNMIVANYTTCGFKQVCDKYGINLYTAMKEKKVKTDGKLVKEFSLIEPAVDCDIKINLAKFKTHAMTGMSGAVKNNFGTVAGLKKAEFHMQFPKKDSFADMIVDLCETVKPDLTIVDGVVAMEGNGPQGGEPKNVGVILYGENPYNIDLAITKMMGFTYAELPIVKAFVLRGLAERELSADLLVGDTDAYITISDFKRPDSYRDIGFDNYLPRGLRWLAPLVQSRVAPHPVINTKKCIGCGRCRDICPQQVITVEDRKANINPQNCIKCFCCHEVCPANAIDIKRSGVFKI